MYRFYRKDELIVMGCYAVFALVYRLSGIIPPEAALVTGMAAGGYIFFNRPVMLVINALRMRGDHFDTEGTIREIRQVQIRSGHYPAFITDYTDADGRAHSIEIHAAFSIRKWKAGDRIRLRVSRSDPEKVIVRSSDAAMAVIMCSIGAALEAVLLAVLIRTH